jgi:predicted CXXCH cytochrome family protein
MAKRRKPDRGHAASASSQPPSHSNLPQARPRPWRFIVASVLAALLLTAAWLAWRTWSPAGAPVARGPAVAAQFAGSGVCAGCHARQAESWRGSHHALAMQVAGEHTVLGNFNNADFRYAGIASRFFRREGRFMVRTDGPDGKLADFEVKYTFGVTPLQQYLIEFPGGRLQALSIAWDSRPKSAGGQRWFHLYPSEKIDHKDQLHWTGLYQNWNLQCAECHSTNLRKGYDAASHSYKTTYSEINVACESCHGPGSRHVEWAKQAGPPYASGSDMGLLQLKSRWNEAWKYPAADAKTAQRDKSAADALMNVCAACHARRSTIAESGQAGAPLEDAHRLALLTQPNYHADGQQREEVYIWGSFRQSKMFLRGVTCMDCHEPHALKLRAEGNALCVRCHNSAAFDAERHHFHQAGSKGSQCVECHMPTQTYMVVDPRRDHSIRVPRPDLTISLGSPNACTQCHTGGKPEWAAAAMDKWYGKSWRDRRHYGTTLHAGATQGVKALPALLALTQDAEAPPIVKATAATLAGPHIRPQSLPVVRKLLVNHDPAMRIAALGLIEPFEPAVRAQATAPLLADPVRGVRIEAARVLADIRDDQLAPGEQRAREAAANEYVESLRQDADWPAANVNFGNLRIRQGRSEEAIAAYERALALDPRFAGAYVNLTDAYRQLEREAEGEKVLRRGLNLLPRAADLHHALGLLLVRKGDKGAAITELAVAAKLAPANARYGFVYAVGLHAAGKRSEALTVLRAAETRHPYDLEILGTLVAMIRETGKPRDALPYARKIAEILPDDPGVKRLVSELEGSK